MSEAIVYIDRSDIHAGKVDDVRAAIGHLVGFIEEREQQLIDYRFSIDEVSRTMALVAIHPDSVSLEFHMEVGSAEFRKLAPLIALRSIEVFGQPSEKALEQLARKAEMLGQDAILVVHKPFAGFTRYRR